MADVLTEHQINVCRKAFSLFDQEGKGFVEQSALYQLFQCLGLNPVRSELKRFLAAKIAEDEAISFPNLLELWTILMRESDSVKQLKNAFRIFDETGSGSITVGDLKGVLIGCGQECLSVEEMNEVLEDLAVPTEDDKQLVQYERIVTALTMPIPIFAQANDIEEPDVSAELLAASLDAPEEAESTDMPKDAPNDSVVPETPADNPDEPAGTDAQE